MKDYDFEFQKIYNELKYEIETGKQGIKAGAIGELLISSSEKLTSMEECVLSACIKLLHETKVPIFITVENVLIIDELIEFLNK